MRTLIAGLDALRRAPTAMLPFTLEGLAAALFLIAGIIPAGGASAAAGAAFPLDVFFDLKQSLASASNWPLFAALVVTSIAVRSLSLTVTLWLAEGRPATLRSAWARTARLTAIAAATLAPAAILYFMGVAVRYSPFIWIGAVLGFFAALALTRRGLRLDVGGGVPPGGALPETLSYLAYAYLLALVGAAMSALQPLNSLLPALLLVFFGPINALFVLGWRSHLRAQTYPGGGALSMVATVLVVATLWGATIYDRVVRSPPPVGRTSGQGTLFTLGGVDSTEETGALADLDSRQVGYNNSRSLSYLGAGRKHSPRDTHRSLRAVADVVSAQLERGRGPRMLLGHSQAALVMDRILDRGLMMPDRSAMLGPPPPFPPALLVPPASQSGVGRVGGDVTRAVSKILEAIGGGVDVDSDASPVNLEPVVVIDSTVPRLSVWALGDSVWLDRDWRRPGEVNVLAITDHVGVTNNGRALTIVQDFLAGERVPDDSSTWRGLLAAVVRHAFAPWRPALPEE